MKILLFGSTGNLGRHVLPSLLSHNPTSQITILIRSLPKLHSILPPSITAHPNLTIEIGDATDSAAVEKLLLKYQIDTIVDVAGNQVYPWQEYELSKIAKSVSDAAVAAGKISGQPLRAWFIGGMGLLPHPRTKWNVQDYIPKVGTIQHMETYRVLSAVVPDDLQWSLLCVAIMHHKHATIELPSAPRSHDLVVQVEGIPGWEDCWLAKIPIVGEYLNIWFFSIWKHTAWYEDVADFLAADVAEEKGEFVGRKVGYKLKEKCA